MDGPLSLENIRNVLTRLEETIIFQLIERAQFCRNEIIYVPDGVGPGLGGESLVGFLLWECETSHAKVRRYTSPDEHPFFERLPAPILPRLAYENPLHPNHVNLNARIRRAYENEIVPFACRPGDDRQWGSSAVCDVALLQSISKRIHYGKFVAEAKYRERPAFWEPLIREGDRVGLLAGLTDESIEAQVLERVHQKAARYGGELERTPGQHPVEPETVRSIYARWIIPLNKDVQVAYLLVRFTAPGVMPGAEGEVGEGVAGHAGLA